MLESVRKCDPQRRQPHLVELEKILPSIQDVYHSYLKLRELCAPESDRNFMVSVLCPSIYSVSQETIIFTPIFSEHDSLHYFSIVQCQCLMAFKTVCMSMRFDKIMIKVTRAYKMV